MEAACQADGWSVEYSQLQAGKLIAETVLGRCADIALLDKCASRRIEAIGKAPERYVTVIVPTGRAETRINGQVITGGGVFVFDAGAEFHIISNANDRILLMLVPSSLLRMARSDIFGNGQASAQNRTGLIEPGAALARSLTLLMYNAIYQPKGKCWRIAQASRLTTMLATIIARHAGTSKKNYRTSSAESMRTIERAHDFIEAHFRGSLSVMNICADSAISLSKLERTFRRELNMSPSEYILARRLVAVNRDLKSASSNGKHIAQIALDCGFNHLSRFSGSYRAHFGELPSETSRYR